MYLKEIEMQGFKSFADKTKVTFDQGVTAVVGPNGSGKSNITESLRWALGESSAKSLRGGKMPDVIFAGTENRHALNFAQVRVTLDNSDGFIADAGEEIRVERHIYRNGDSDYLIDGRKVRLRDIHDLFLDTGLGRDSFSIISQGRVEEIFNSKPEERRAIFEEAAGVLKYKTRKKETESKLKQTQDNLDRLEDIIYELDMQVKPLEKQAETAKRFQVLEAERRTLFLNLLVDSIHKNKEKLQSLESDLAQVKEDLSAYYQERSSLEADNQKLKNRRQKLVQEQQTKQEELIRLTSLIGDLESRIQISQLQASQSKEKESENRSRLESLSQEKASLEESLQTSEERLAQLDQDLAQQREKISQLEEHLQDFSSSPDQIIEGLRDRFVGLMQEEADLSNQLTALQSDMDKAREQSENQSEELAQLSAELISLKDEAKDALASYESAKEAVKELLDAYQLQNRDLAAQEDSYRQAQNQLFDNLDQLKNKKARQNSLESILKSHSNFYAGVKAVLQNAEQLGGILGAVSESVTFDPSYQTAMEIALGPSSQNIIVADEAAAKRAINYLKQSRQGRATFLPLTTIKARQMSPRNLELLQSSQGFKGLASDLVTYDKSLETIFQNLLGVTAVFDTVDHANSAARALNYQVRIVTLDGTELRPGGSFSGGANRQNNTTFIKPELDALTQEIQELEASQLSDEKALEAKKAALDKARQTLEDLKRDGEDARFLEQKAELNYQQLADRLADLQKLLDRRSQSAQLLDQTQAEEKKAQLETRLAKIAQSKEELTQEIDQIKTDKDSIEEKVNQLRDQLSDARLLERELTSEQKFASSNRLRQEMELKECDRQMRVLSQALESQDSGQVEEIPRLKEQLAQAGQDKASREQDLIRLRFESEDIDGQLDDLEEQLQKLSSKNDDFIRHQAQLESSIEQVSANLRQSSQTLTEDYRLSYQEALNQAEEIEDLPLAEMRLKDLGRQIKDLGPINLDAIAQFDEVNDRLIFLNSQRDDLVSAKDLLLDTMSDMDDEVKTRFKVTFEAIRLSFKETFSQMFGGGSADLILTDGDLLNSGIEISVQPPGKKIQSLNLMSGGEKALSALALLFAIIRVKTIPFVILDEVEAALDEANVKRFGDYLNRFDKSSQFIVVTHRKGTMAAADSIYGVTMQESGISKIVSVKLKEAEQLTR
ncbi:chromosome segregation protein SMC [Streptococcus loxodontisalivarius]|uniref:Chromosome partition protein Smc n=1 Tax=Streptococcus loxodontisalivarius TaxID=1349415 RepID=A0ABS2PUA2_9STRE|nr:chromosome segregation protein SMC [Streptococcus loxodontisalivarius]MBM7643636.1 chromosome segregation protein [Streptococcus loxodontisalivarius]